MTAPFRPGGPPVWLGGASESALEHIINLKGYLS